MLEVEVNHDFMTALKDISQKHRAEEIAKGRTETGGRRKRERKNESDESKKNVQRWKIKEGEHGKRTSRARSNVMPLQRKKSLEAEVAVSWDALQMIAR